VRIQSPAGQSAEVLEFNPVQAIPTATRNAHTELTNSGRYE